MDNPYNITVYVVLLNVLPNYKTTHKIGKFIDAILYNNKNFKNTSVVRWGLASRQINCELTSRVKNDRKEAINLYAEVSLQK